MNKSDINHFSEEGYVILRGLIPTTLIRDANQAIDQILDEVANGTKEQTFHWINELERIPAFINDLLTPAKYHESFGQILDQFLIPISEELMAKKVRCSWLLLLTGGSKSSYAASLHRDNCEIGSPQEGELMKEHDMNLCYFQAPLLADDHFLQVVPRSHLRMATAREVEVARTVEGSTDVPGLITIQLEPGDVIFRQTNLIHQGWNPEGKIRRTLVSGMWAEHLPIQQIELRDYDTLNNEAFINELPDYLGESVQRYVDKYRETVLQPASER